MGAEPGCQYGRGDRGRFNAERAAHTGGAAGCSGTAAGRAGRTDDRREPGEVPLGAAGRHGRGERPVGRRRPDRRHPLHRGVSGAGGSARPAQDDGSPQRLRDRGRPRRAGRRPDPRRRPEEQRPLRPLCRRLGGEPGGAGEAGAGGLPHPLARRGGPSDHPGGRGRARRHAVWSLRLPAPPGSALYPGSYTRRSRRDRWPTCLGST